MGSNPCFFRKMSVKVNLQDHLAVDLVLYMSLSCRMYYLCHEFKWKVLKYFLDPGSTLSFIRPW